MKRGVIVCLFFLVVFFLFVVITAEHEISPVSFSKEINIASSFSITITNTDPADPLSSSNITQVTIILPNELSFIEGTNSTDSLSEFANNSNELTWTNSTNLISSGGGENVKIFSFDANPTNLGIFNVTVKTINFSGETAKNISLTVSDTTAPEAILATPASNAEDEDGTIEFKCTSSDNYELDTIILYIYSGDEQIYKNSKNVTGTTNETTWDYTFSEDGSYKWNCFLNDSFNNKDWASNRTISIDTSSLCTPDWDCTSWGLCTNNRQTRTCTDLNDCVGDKIENQSCCVPDWECTDWQPEKCPKSEEQTRTCTDSRDCSSSTGKPTETRTCEYKNYGTVIFIIIVVVVLLITGTVAFFLLKGKNKSQTQSQKSLPQGYTQL